MEVAELADKLVAWIQEKVREAGCRGIVLGMSGGLDSSVLAALCRRASSENVLGIIMPCHSNPQDEEHARLAAEKFGVTTEKVPLEGVFEAFLKVFPGKEAKPGNSKLAEANVKVRLRMVTLYYFANQLGYLVAGSSNRSELFAGYFTKYGDGGSDILPMGKLVKGQVRELARFLGVPRPIIDKPPSAGLWHGQTDEYELGFSYDELDRYLTTGEAIPELKPKFDSMALDSKHKCLPPPVPDFDT